MNERILELARIAQGKNPAEYDKDDNVVLLATMDVEKFAELLIRECSHIAKVNQLQSMNWDIGEILLEHFGVE